MKNYFLTTVGLLLFASQIALAQSEDKPKYEIFTGVDFMSRHSWRGGMVHGTSSIEPTLELRKGKWTFGAWFAATLNDTYKELDLYVNYAVSPQFSVSLFDYYCPPNKLSDTHFYQLGKEDTHHLFDVIFTYKFKKIPLKLSSATIFAGMDRNTEGDLRYSTYLEASYIHTWNNYALTGIIAGTPWESSYANKADFVNLELKLARNFQLKRDVNLPVFGRIIYNPNRDKMYYIVGFSLLGLTKF